MAPVNAPALAAAPRGFKADLIRKHLEKTPNATGNEIAEAVNADAKSQNILVECSAAEVYPYKNKMNEGAATADGQPAQRKARTPKIAAPVVPQEVTVSECITAVDFCKPLGGMEAVAKRIKEMAAITEKFGSVERFTTIVEQFGRFTGNKKVMQIFGSEKPKSE